MERTSKPFELVTADYSLNLELTSAGHYFVHLQVYRWSPGVKREINDVLSHIVGIVGELRAAVRHTDTKLAKFTELMGFKKKSWAYLGHHGNFYDIYIRRH